MCDYCVMGPRLKKRVALNHFGDVKAKFWNKIEKEFENQLYHDDFRDFETIFFYEIEKEF
jgi:hypothetical protein